MYALDLFENTNPIDQSSQIPVAPHVPGEKNRQIGNANLSALLSALNNPENPSVSIQFLDGSREVLSPALIDLIIYYYNKVLTTKTQRANFLYRTFVSRNKLFTLLNQLEQKKAEAEAGQKSFSFAPDPVNPDEVKPQQLDLFKEEKKSSKYKDVAVQRAMRQAVADFPTAASDAEAFAKSMMAQQDQDKKNIDRLKSASQHNQELINKNDELDQSQARSIDGIQREINKVEKDNDSLTQMVQQMSRANAELQATLDRMKQKKPSVEPAVKPATKPQVGVSVATDKIPAQATVGGEPAEILPSSPIDIGARQKLDQLSKAVTGSILSLQNKETAQGLTPAERERLEKLETQYADLKNQYSTLAKQLKRSEFGKIPGKLVRTQVAQNDPDARVVANFHEDLTHGLEEGEVIPTKQVLQGYVVEYDPRAKVVTISQRGQLLKQYKMATPSRRAYDQTVNKFIHSQEDDKYPMDIDDRDVRLPMKKVAEALPAKAAKELYRWKNQQAQQAQQAPVAEPTVAPAGPQPVPARLSDLQARQQKFETLTKIKKKIEAAQKKATSGGRLLPRGLAADLEDYYTVADVDQHYDEILAKYTKQLEALEQYANMKKILNKKVTHEMRAQELNESGMETWTVHFTDGTAVRVRVSDETDPAMVRKHYASKGKTVSKFDYGYGVEPETGPGPEAHEPGSGRAVSARTGDPLPESEISITGQPIKQEEGYYAIYIKRGDRWSPLTKYPDRAEAEEIKRGLEKRGEEVIIRETKWKKETPWTKSTGKDPRGEVTHMSDVARKETERREREASPMGQLFKDFEKVFGKKPPVKEGDVVNINRAGYNQFRDKNDFLDKRDYIQKQLLDPSQRENYNELKQRLQDINYAGRKLGYIK